VSGYGAEHYGQAYYGVDGIDLPVSTLVLSQAFQDILTGADPKPIECYADVTVGGVAIPKVEGITIERALGDRMGTARVTVLCTASTAPTSIIENAEIVITAGLKYGIGSAGIQVFRGRVDSWKPPDEGEIRGQLFAYDGAKRLEDASVSGAMTGDVATWLADQCAALSMGTGFAVVTKGTAVNIATSYSLAGFRSVLDAAQVLVSAWERRYVFFNGAGELVIFDPQYIAYDAPQFEFSRAISFRELTDTSKRFNRVAYSNYIGYAHDFVTYTLTVTESGANTITASNVSTVPIISGTYNDAADQATYGVLELSGGVQNNIPTTDALLLAYATSVSRESKRSRYQFTTRFNPFLELGTMHSFAVANYFTGRLRHSLTSSGLWTTDAELWGAA
jgi:hypothetical protein